MTNQQKEAIILSYDPELQHSHYTIVVPTSIYQKGTDPKPIYEVYPGQRKFVSNQSTTDHCIGGCNITIIDQFSDHSVRWFDSQLSRRKNEFHVHAQAAFGPDPIIGVVAVKVFQKLSKLSQGVLKATLRSSSPLVKAQYRLGRYIKSGGNYNISLGRRSEIYDLAEKTKSTPFTKLFDRGFTDKYIPMGGANKLSDWFPGVKQSISTAIENGGRVFWHLDGFSVKDLGGIWNSKHNLFSNGAFTELRYLIDADLLKHTDFFFNGGKSLPDGFNSALNEAIDQYRKVSPNLK